MQRHSVLAILSSICLTITTNSMAAVVARAGVTQRVVNTGTKVTAATQNTVISETCQNRYDACMDAFCMLDNAPGGRCICNNAIFELDKKQAQIDKTQSDSYKLATAGLQTVESGTTARVVAKKRIDLSMWNNNGDDSDDDSDSEIRGAKLLNDSHKMCIAKIPDCAQKSDILKTIYNQKTKSDCAAYENGLKEQQKAATDKLNTAQRAMRSAAHQKMMVANKYDLGQCTIEFRKCMQTTAGCGEDFSGCAAVAAIENTNTRRVSSRAAKNYVIKGSATSIEIAASTYEQLESKKPICESITKQCTSVADQVWDTFLRDIAPTIKNAELIAENKVRQDCIGNISNCFQKACKDNIDPSDPDGSYDMCLTNPASMLGFCGVELNACGIKNTDIASAEKSPIWEYVVARLGAMRVDSCTTAVRECLTAEDRCGKDYLGCVGLDTNTIIRMCPYDKLTGCQQKYGDVDIRGDKIYDELSSMIQGVMLNIDNNLLTVCQNAVNESMLRTCGSTDNCNNMFASPDTIGSESLRYQICPWTTVDNTLIIATKSEFCHATPDGIPDVELGRVEGSTTGQLGPVTSYMGTLDGTIYWESVNVKPNGLLTNASEYISALQDSQTNKQHQQERISDTLNNLQHNINAIIETIESDPTVQYCMTGRKLPNFESEKFKDYKNIPRFPNLTHSTRMQITNAALKQAKDNYYRKYDELSEQMLRDYGIIAERQAEIRDENAKDVRREAARRSCIALAEMSSLPKSPPPPQNIWGMIIIGAILVAAMATVIALTAGAAAGPLTAVVVTSTTTTTTTVTAGTAATGIAALTSLAPLTMTLTATMAATTTTVLTAAGTAAAVVGAVGAAAAATTVAFAAVGASAEADAGSTDDVAMELETQGFYEMKQWNYEESITTDFHMRTLNCHKCTVSKRCVAIRDPVFGTKSCKKWADPEETCTDIQF